LIGLIPFEILIVEAISNPSQTWKIGRCFSMFFRSVMVLISLLCVTLSLEEFYRWPSIRDLKALEMAIWDYKDAGSSYEAVRFNEPVFLPRSIASPMLDS
jgi:hypothetical protein